MGLFGGGNSKRTTVNEDNRIIYDQSGSTFDNSVDRSRSYEDNSYSDTSRSYEDNSYSDTSRHFTDESYTDTSSHYSDESYSDSSTAIDNADNSYTDTSSHYSDESYTDTSSHFTDESYTDTSTHNMGQYSGNSGSLVITDGGAFETVQSTVQDLSGMGGLALETLGKTADKSMEQAAINNSLMRDVAASALSEYSDLSSNAIDGISSTASNSMQASSSNVEQMRLLASSALQRVSDSAAVAVSSSNMANRASLDASTKLMTTVSANGNDLLIDGVVKIAKYVGLGAGALVTGLVVIKVIGGKK
jgi:hypothetical protein